MISKSSMAQICWRPDIFIPVASSTAMPIQGELWLSQQDQALEVVQLDTMIVNSGTLLFKEPHGNSAVSHVSLRIFLCFEIGISSISQFLYLWKTILKRKNILSLKSLLSNFQVKKSQYMKDQKWLPLLMTKVSYCLMAHIYTHSIANLKQVAHLH